MRPFTSKSKASGSVNSAEDASRETSMSMHRPSAEASAPRLADSLRDPFDTPAASRPESLSDSIAPNPYASGVSTPNANAYGLPSPSWSRSQSLYGSRAGSTIGARSGFQYGEIPGTGYFRSRRIVKGEAGGLPPRKKQKEDKILWIMPIVGLALGFCLAGVAIWYQLWFNTDKNSYCSVMDEDFSSGIIDPKWWNQEVELGGYGNHHFDQTTADGTNSYVKDGQLVIKPTLTDATLIDTNNVVNLTADGSCTSTVWSNCWAATNTTNGTIVPPVRSARLNTKGKASIKYGKVEVRAKIPVGDWLWPAIWMLPTDDVYGSWPASGEIDIMESRGNNYSYSLGGNNFVTSSLHWAPTTATDAYKRTQNDRSALHSLFGEQYHTYGLVWNQKYIFTYIDNSLVQVYYWTFPKTGLWSFGEFQASNSNGSSIGNPWATGTNTAPFDQDFYLILNVAVGGTNGYFLDGADSKPWSDASPYARSEFWKARNSWYPTWQKNNQGQMMVDSVKMYKIC